MCSTQPVTKSTPRSRLNAMSATIRVLLWGWRKRTSLMLGMLPSSVCPNEPAQAVGASGPRTSLNDSSGCSSRTSGAAQKHASGNASNQAGQYRSWNVLGSTNYPTSPRNRVQRESHRRRLRARVWRVGSGPRGRRRVDPRAWRRTNSRDGCQVQNGQEKTQPSYVCERPSVRVSVQTR